MWIHDPDGTATSRRRRRAGALLVTLGIIALVPGVGAAAIVGSLGVAGTPLGVGGVVALAGGWLLRRGTVPLRLDTDGLGAITVMASDVAGEGRERLAANLRRQQRLVDTLEQAVGAGGPDRRLTELGRADAALTVARVRWRAATDLADAADRLESLLIESDDDPAEAALTRVTDLHGRAEESLRALGELAATLAPSTGGSAVEEHQRAMAELRAVTEWVGHRQQALHDLRSASGRASTTSSRQP